MKSVFISTKLFCAAVAGAYFCLAATTSASANVMTFGDSIKNDATTFFPTPISPYIEDGITATPTSAGPNTHFDIGDLSIFNLGGSPANAVAGIHQGNGGDAVTFTFAGGAFNLTSVDITGWRVVNATSFTSTFTASSGATKSILFSLSPLTPQTSTIDFTALPGWTDLTSFIFSVSTVSGCEPTQSCSLVGFDNVTLFAANASSETPLPAALPLFATGLGVLGFGAYRRKRKALAA